MRSFILLLKIQLLGLFGINKALHANAAKAKRTLALAALVVAAIVAVAALYSVGVAEGMAQLGMVEAIPLVAVLVGAVAGAVAAFLKTNGVLFAFKDYDLVMSLPVPTLSVVLSRIASLYAMSVAFGLLVMVPAFAVYAAHAGAGALSVVLMALSIVLAPLAPLAAAIVLAALIAAFSSRFRHANIVMTVLSLVAVLAIVAGSFALSGQSDDAAALAALGTEAVGQMAGLFPPAAWAAEGIASGNLLSFALFAGVSLLAGAVLLAVLVRVFVPVNSLLMSSRPHGSFSFDGAAHGARGLRARTPFRALVGKELRLLVATPIYLLNGCMGYVLVVVACIAAVAARALGALSLDALPAELTPLVGGFLRGHLVHDGAVGVARGLRPLGHAHGAGFRPHRTGGEGRSQPVVRAAHGGDRRRGAVAGVLARRRVGGGDVCGAAGVVPVRHVRGFGGGRAPSALRLDDGVRAGEARQAGDGGHHGRHGVHGRGHRGHGADGHGGLPRAGRGDRGGVGNAVPSDGEQAAGRISRRRKENVMRERNKGKVLEGKPGLAVAVALGVAAVALAALQWILLPDQVVTHFGVSGQANGWSPKWFLVLLSTGLGLFGAVWFGASREKLGLLLAAIGVVVGVFDLVVNGIVF